MFGNIKNNPMLNMLKMAQNPQQTVMNMFQQRMGNNPMMQYVFQLAQSNNSAQIETIARNLLQEAGFDPDETYNEVSKLVNNPSLK